MSEAPQDNHTPDEPRISANEWYALAVSGAILAATGFVIAFIWVFWCDDKHAINERAQAVAPFGAAAIAIVTFFTIAWRGVQTDHQLRQQAEQVRFQGRQLEQIVRQNDAKEDENLTKVLQEGAKLIADKDKTSQALAGISSLDYLVSKGVSPFAEQAADLLSNFLMETYGAADLNRISRAIITALQRCEDNQIIPGIDGVFDAPSDDGRELTWAYIPAIRNLTLTGGALNSNTYKRIASRIQTLQKVKIYKAAIESPDEKFQKCSFNYCKFNSIDTYELSRNNFYRCDFSGALIEIDDEFGLIDENTLRDGQNYFKSGREPTNVLGDGMGEWLLTEREFRKLEATELDL